MRVVVREAVPADLAVLADIENAGDARFIELFAPESWWPAMPGEERVSTPGFVLVAVDEADHLVGFAHVIELSGSAHLEQLSVLPSHGRRGVGKALVTAALEVAARHGCTEVTLRTYASVPWNAPFYASLGFRVTEPATPFQRRLLREEKAAGLDRYGARVQMTACIPASQ